MQWVYRWNDFPEYYSGQNWQLFQGDKTTHKCVYCTNLDILYKLKPKTRNVKWLVIKFLSSIRQRALTRACAYDLQPPFPRTDSGKRTFLYSASILFNCLDSDCKQLAASPSCSSYTNAKQKIRKIFLNKLNLTNHIEDLFCINCKYLLNCNCIHY